MNLYFKTMDKIYRIITSYTNEQTHESLSKFSDRFVEEVIKFSESLIWADFFDLKYDGKTCHWSKGDMQFHVGVTTDDVIEQFKMYDEIIHEGIEGFTSIEDLTTEVLYSMHDYQIYGFLKEEVQITFEEFIKNNLTVDIVLDKVSKYGAESLTDNEKRFLNNEPMIFFIDQFDLDEEE